MRNIDSMEVFLIRGHPHRWNRAFTLVELLLIVAIVGTLGAIGVPTYNGYVDRARSASAMADIVDISQRIGTFQAERGALPDALGDVGINQLDPWGRAYQYLRIDGGDIASINSSGRKDHGTHPINTDFDLYSMGKDGRSEQPLTAQASHDDVIRANNGTFIGLASDY